MQSKIEWQSAINFVSNGNSLLILLIHIASIMPTFSDLF